MLDLWFPGGASIAQNKAMRSPLPTGKKYYSTWNIAKHNKKSVCAAEITLSGADRYFLRVVPRGMFLINKLPRGNICFSAGAYFILVFLCVLEALCRAFCAFALFYSLRHTAAALLREISSVTGRPAGQICSQASDVPQPE